MRRAESRVCWHCRVAFLAKRKDIVYCTASCADQHRASMSERAFRLQVNNRAVTMRYHVQQRARSTGRAA